ncbi:hypothetical protein [Sulfuriferula sp. AH1]|uniref:hypothetical protein n=1 Tax=Sulfuriferula sp. AH1 TaxID=1985873 RepID=UPI0012F74B48|nr:hypothetical protein [Sulfuriferula sp. AH1]
MRILTYKRTHTGDPDNNGSFGINGCMGQVRGYAFEAVIGVGGIGAEPRAYGIDRKINWVGINPKPSRHQVNGAPIISFEHFFCLNTMARYCTSMPLIWRAGCMKMVRVFY